MSLQSFTTRLLFIFAILCTAVVSHAEVQSVLLDKPTKLDGLLYHNGQLYGAAGWDGSLIHAIDPDGKVTTVGVIPRGPIDMVTDNKGNLIITSYGSNSVYRLNIATGEKEKIVTLPSFAGAIATYRPGEYLIGSASRLYWINEQGDYKVYVKNLDQIDNPTGLVVDGTGRIYVGNLNRSTILVIDDESRDISLLATLPNAGNHNIGKLALHKGVLYATHLSQEVVYAVDTDSGDIQIFAGQEQVQGQVDGQRQQATLTSPNGLALDAERQVLWIAQGYGPVKHLRTLDLAE